MVSTVSARIPTELRDRVHERLRARGLTPTELITAAYEYYFAQGELPEAVAEPVRRGRMDVVELEAYLDSFYVAGVADGAFADDLYGDDLAAAKLEEYEALS
jgi:antitoxin component of RelBE/YafQ-DinJ toxin-antitoxin module